ncbi:MAG: hypothetical protein MUE31_10880, partial [Candidatus Nanopelagicales bacterium]|nr:hypothetical protein [Candidatus Nanopelagicales bacterium]
DQCGLAMVHVGDDRDIPQVTAQGHEEFLALGDAPSVAGGWDIAVGQACPGCGLVTTLQRL